LWNCLLQNYVIVVDQTRKISAKIGRIARMPKPRKVSTPGYTVEQNKKSSDRSGKKRKSSGGKKSNSSGGKVSKSGSGGDATQKNKKRVKRKGTVHKDNYRNKYKMEDMDEAVRLVMEEGYSVAAAARAAGVPRMILNDRVRSGQASKEPLIGRPQVLRKTVEEAIVKCLCLCAEFQYPMRKCDLQQLVQAYILENNVETRWADRKPGKHWIRKFRKRWSHRVKVTVTIDC
jgi:transposase-like protein